LHPPSRPPPNYCFTIYGRPKTYKALQKLVQRAAKSQNNLAYIDHMLVNFKVLFPNWPDAYLFWDGYFKESQKQGVKRLNL